MSNVVKEENINRSYIVLNCEVIELTLYALDESLGEQLWMFTKRILKETLGSEKMQV
jgi:hypothetical protein